jgi:ABC-type multidrug transport system fused ATPase/permease subunit
MNIVTYLLKKFFYEEMFNTTVMITLSIVITTLQMNVISFVTANIIESVNDKNPKMTYSFFYMFICISIISLLLNHNYIYFQNTLLTKLRQWLKYQLIKILLLVNNEDFIDTNFPSMISPTTRLSTSCFNFFNTFIGVLLPNIIFLVVVSSFFLYENFIFGMVFLVTNILILASFFFNWDLIYSKNKKYENMVKIQEDYLLDILNNIDKIIYKGQVHNEINIFEKKSQDVIDYANVFYNATNMNVFFSTLFIFILLFFSLGYLLYLVFHKKISITIFVTFLTIILLYRDKMKIIISEMPEFIEFIGRIDSVLIRYEELGEQYMKMENQAIATERKTDFNTIRFENVVFKYKKSDKIILNGLNLDLNVNNKIIGINGLSGKGKSTFAKLILKMYKPESGAIYIDDINIKDMNTDYIRKQITYVSQNTKLFDMKVIENMFYGCNDIEQCHVHVNEIIKYKKIKELYKNIDIYNKNAGSLGENLSGGQRQIVNIISGLINPSPILILDEPTNSIDIELKKELLGIIKDFKKYKKCIIIITHDRDVNFLFNETIVI